MVGRSISKVASQRDNVTSCICSCPANIIATSDQNHHVYVASHTHFTSRTQLSHHTHTPLTSHIPHTHTVILSPSGLNAVMTGHSYKSSDPGIDDILEEWKLFFQRRFTLDPSPGLPAAIEVILGGVRMRYPSQFVFVYHGSEGTDSSNPPSHSSLSAALLERRSVEELMQGAWDMSNCADTVQ